MTRSRKRKLARNRAKWVSMPLATAILAGGGARAADSNTAATADTGVLEEVTVTAEKRSEDLQKVPISLTVIGSEKLEQLEVQSFDDYAKFLPSVTFQSLAPGQAQLYFRGISSGEDGLHAGSLPATGVYLDETPLTTPSAEIPISISTTSPASRHWPVRKVRCMARAPCRVPYASSPTSPMLLSSLPVTM